MSILSVKPIREVSDQEYEEALEQYTPCLAKNAVRWRKTLGIDEARHLGTIALWRAMQSYDQNRMSRKGEKANFLTHLMNYLHWTCLEAQKVELKTPFARNLLPSDALAASSEIDDRCEAIKPHLNQKQKDVVDLLREGKDATFIMGALCLSRQRIHQIFAEIRIIHMDLSKAGRF
jgi:DNA-directed RNA polymerase specialized sigma subunit